MTKFTVDEVMSKTLDGLKDQFGLVSRAEVMKRAVALLKIAAELEDSQGNLTLLKRDGTPEVIKLR